MKNILLSGFCLVSMAFAGLKKDALGFVPRGWEVDEHEMVVADFNKDGVDDIALVYYKVDADSDELNNRINRVLALLGVTGAGKKLVPVVDQRFPEDQDYGTEVMIEYEDGILKIFQHMGFMHKFNEWGLAWDEFAERFWERTYASGGIMGLGSITGYDARTGLGYVEKVWNDVDVTAEYSTIFAEEALGDIKLDGYDNEADWQRAWVADNYWVTYGAENWADEADASLKIWSLFDEENLYLYIEVFDDDFVFPRDADDVLKSDHLELWFDGLTADVAAEVYAPEPWKRKKDVYVNQLAIAQSASGELLVERWLPEGKDDYVSTIQAGFTKSDASMSAELAVPWEEFDPHGMQDYLSLTVVYSDADDRVNPKQETLIATSQLRWAEPFTFGSLLTQKPIRSYWGIYPEEK